MPERGPIWIFHFQDTSPTAGVVGGHKFSQTVPVAGSPRDYEFSAGGQFEQRTVGEVGGGTVDLEGGGGGVAGADDRGTGGYTGCQVWRLGGPGPGVGFLRIVALLEAGAPKVDVAAGPVVAVGGVLADDDPETSLAR